MIISGILGFLKSIYYAISGIGILTTIIFRYIDQFFDFVSRSLTAFNASPLGLPTQIVSVLVLLFTLLIIFKILGRS